ncbi:MAG: potassium-transporting ATPase subunit KdpA [Chlamydiae bacterium]|nr:potassium-transporting ATPase subunit KdpA [Chlamydiota bacterium]
MHYLSFLQLLIFFVALLITARYLGIHLYNVLTEGKKPFLSSVIGPLEKLTYKIARIDTNQTHSWKQYLASILLLSLLGIVFVLAILLGQGHLPLNSQHFGALPFPLALNIAISFVTNTNLQNYAPETTLSAFSQMTALNVQNFISPAIGLCIAAALVRAISSKGGGILGNFWVDFIRVSYYIFLPLALILSVLFLAQGTPQNLETYTSITTIEGSSGRIIQGPIASQEAIKVLGTNGGGYTNTSSAHPFENPSPFSNYLQIFFMMILPFAQIFYFGKSIDHKKHARSIFAALGCILLIGIACITTFESKANPALTPLAIESSQGNREGKELRFSIISTSLYTACSSASTNGAVCSNIDSYSPLGGMIPLINIQLGETIFGGIGSGLYKIIILILIAVYLAGLIAGKTPEYFGKKIESFDIKMMMSAVCICLFTTLGSAAWAIISPWGKEVILNNGPHGFTEVLYTFCSATGNNGSSFLGSASSTSGYNWVTSLAMLIGRFGPMIPVMALANSLNRKKIHTPNGSSLPLTGLPFILLLIGILLTLGALTYLPSLIMGPILEHVFSQEGVLF